jgi:hypothetical protein
MPSIIWAEYLSYLNPSRNSDKIYNLFLIAQDDGRFSCISEYGRRGNALIVSTICINRSRQYAEAKLLQKLASKRNHRETPYSNASDERRESRFLTEFDLPTSYIPALIEPELPAKNAPPPPVIAEPKKPRGLLNSGQFDSLEV